MMASLVSKEELSEMQLMSEQRLEQLEKTINGHILENKDKMGK